MNQAVEFLVNNNYINFPVRKNAPKKIVSLLMGKSIMQQFEIELTAENPDFWVFTDLRRYIGQQITIAVESDADLLAMIHLSDEINDQETMYSEKYRPQYHFTSRRGWLNDPNGLHFYKGVYHLFYQHNPYGVAWGNMHWGHATSIDLVHWEDFGDVLFPDRTGTMFSGSGVVDRYNTTGFKTGSEIPQVLIYTAAGGTSLFSKAEAFTQCLAFSNDRGLTWEKYDKNPVITHICGDNRDPKAFWYEATKEWIMALYLQSDQYAIFSSPDLKSWVKICEIAMPECTECPDFFQLSVDGDPGNKKWVFWGATRGAYRVGDFDGKRFTPETNVMYSVNEGAHSFAAQTWNDIPEEDGRRIQISWANFSFPGMPFNGFMTFPCTLTLRNTRDGYRLFVYPVREIEKLYDRKHSFNYIELSKEIQLTDGKCNQLDIRAEFIVGSAQSFGFYVLGTALTYKVKEEMLVCGNQTSHLAADGGKINLRILVDTTSIEIFANEGIVYMPLGLIHERPESGIIVFAHGGQSMVCSLEINELKSIWPMSVYDHS